LRGFEDRFGDSDRKTASPFRQASIGSLHIYQYIRYLKSGGKLTTKNLETLQTRTFTGKEKKSLAYVIAIMNMIVHGIDAPDIVHTNTLSENLADIQEKARYDVVLVNPQFGGKERKEVQQNFPIRTGETAFDKPLSDTHPAVRPCTGRARCTRHS
jgi:type I restriction-modification system DNA methylase subunit